MPKLLERCREEFDTDNLYKVLNVTKKANESEIKKGYHKVSLKVHPDRVAEDEKEAATQKFQTLGKVYCVLSDKDKRAVYDETGDVDDDDDAIPQDRDWAAYWRLLFRKITSQDIKDFEENYKGSEEELADLKTAYVEFCGDMGQIVDNVMCSTHEDEDRFTDIINTWIKDKLVPRFPKFTKETAKAKKTRKRKAAEEAAEAEEMKQEMGLNDSDKSLQALIQSRQQSRESQMSGFFDQLEAKYCKPDTKTKKSAAKSKKKGKK